MSTWRYRLAPVAVVAGLLAAVPAAAQFSDGYKLIKAIKEKDGAAAQKILSTPGTTLVNIRDGATGDAGLHIVVKREDTEWLVYLLQQGADPNIRDRDGATPLLLAVTSGFDEGVRILTSIKAQVDAPNRLGQTPLLMAVETRDLTATRLLIEAGASPDATDNSGRSARAAALADPRASAIARLLKDVPVRNPVPVQGPTR